MLLDYHYRMKRTGDKFEPKTYVAVQWLLLVAVLIYCMYTISIMFQTAAANH